MARTAIDLSLIPSAQKLMRYRRPNLGYGGVTAVGLETALNGVTGEVEILFPDGNMRTETNSTRRTFVITRNAILTNATAQSGLRSGLSEATNTWYALYAVKISDNAAGFVLVGDTVLPLVANFSTLNTNFGTNGWVYLGMCRNGDNASATGDIVYFQMAGPMLQFYNSITGVFGDFMRGIRLAANNGITVLTYGESKQGTGSDQWPNHCYMGNIQVASIPGGTNNTLLVKDFDAQWGYFRTQCAYADRYLHDIGWVEMADGLKAQITAAGTIDLHLVGVWDSILAAGSNSIY